jgi:hypothetical protein
MSYFDRIHLLKISLDNAKYLAEFATSAYYNDQIPEDCRNCSRCNPVHGIAWDGIYFYGMAILGGFEMKISKIIFWMLMYALAWNIIGFVYHVIR